MSDNPFQEILREDKALFKKLLNFYIEQGNAEKIAQMTNLTTPDRTQELARLLHGNPWSTEQKELIQKIVDEGRYDPTYNTGSYDLVTSAIYTHRCVDVKIIRKMLNHPKYKEHKTPRLLDIAMYLPDVSKMLIEEGVEPSANCWYKLLTGVDKNNLIDILLEKGYIPSKQSILSVMTSPAINSINNFEYSSKIEKILKKAGYTFTEAELNTNIFTIVQLSMYLKSIEDCK